MLIIDYIGTGLQCDIFFLDLTFSLGTETVHPLTFWLMCTNHGHLMFLRALTLVKLSLTQLLWKDLSKNKKKTLENGRIPPNFTMR
jgi:hypothetical protein